MSAVTIYIYIYNDDDAESAHEEIDGDTPVIAWVTHGGGVADEERALALNCASNQNTEAIFVVPWTDKPEGVCACLEDAKVRLDGKGNFDAISGHGTSSGGRAMIRAALESVNPDKDYSFRFKNVCAYDPTEETHTTNITGNTEGLKALAEQYTVLFFQTDTDHSGHHYGSGSFCNDYARIYSELGGIGIVAEIYSGNHEAKFTKPLTHNCINWAIGEGPLQEDDSYRNYWYYYSDGEKKATNVGIATTLIQSD